MTTAGLDLHAHDHNFLGSTHDENARRTLWVVALTTVMMVGEIIAGTVFGSMALLADGFHMATHAGALAVAAGAYAFARKYATDPRFSFGTGKVGDLAGFASALVLGIVALGIAVESVMRLLQPEAVDFGPAAMVAVIGLVGNLVSAMLLSGGHHPGHHHGHGLGHGHGHHHDHDHGHDHDDDHAHDAGHGRGAAHKDNNLRAAYVHVLADALTSVLAIVALLAAYNAGPGRYAEHLETGRALPLETRLYVARIAPQLGQGGALPANVREGQTVVQPAPVDPFAAPIFVAAGSILTGQVSPGSADPGSLFPVRTRREGSQ